MSHVTVTCDTSTAESREIDAKVSKVLKIFRPLLDKRKTKEAAKRRRHQKGDRGHQTYHYNNVSPSQINLMKKLLHNNKALLHFDKITVSDTTKTGGSCSSGGSSSSSSISSSSSSSSSSSRNNSISGRADSKRIKKNIYLNRLEKKLFQALNLVRKIQEQ